MRRCIHALVIGRVQGVGYRAAVWKRAVALGLSGWVRNLADGRVEILAAGKSAAVAALLEHCRQGPPAARVDDLLVVENADPPDSMGFDIRRDG